MRALHRGKSTLVIGCWMVVLCGGVPGPTAGTAGADPVDADALIVSLADVRQISGVSEFAADPEVSGDRPRGIASQAPPPCRVVSDQQMIFGSGWSQFRGMVYTATTSPSAGAAKMLSPVTQAIGVYPTADAARAMFDKLTPAATACAGLHAKNYDFTVGRDDPSTLVLTFPEASQLAVLYRVQSSVLIRVSAQAFPQADHTARTILQTITDRIH